jgi:hypothetical protein
MTPFGGCGPPSAPSDHRYPLKEVNVRVTKLTPALVLPFLALACSEAPTATAVEDDPLFAKAGGSGPSVNGRGVMIYYGMRCPSSFHAREHQDGSVTGTMQNNCPAQTVNSHAIVDCLVVDGNEAILGGVLTKVSTGAYTPGWFTGEPGTRFWLKVRDNGEGSKAPPDEWTDWYPDLPLFGLQVTVCEPNTFVGGSGAAPLQESQGANIQVKP